MCRVSKPYVSTGQLTVFQICVFTSQFSPGYDSPAVVNLKTLWLQALILFLMWDLAFKLFVRLTPRMVVSYERVIVCTSSCQVGGSISSGFPIRVHFVFVGLNLILQFLAYDSHVLISF